jgi:hypothetical protein
MDEYRYVIHKQGNGIALDDTTKTHNIYIGIDDTIAMGFTRGQLTTIRELIDELESTENAGFFRSRLKE